MTTLHPTETGTPFRVVADFEPRGDQPQAIDRLADGILKGMRHQTLLGVTGSGKTYTMAKTVEAVQKPTLVIAPNKTLAAQLAQEFRDFFRRTPSSTSSPTTTTTSRRRTSPRPTRISRRKRTSTTRSTSSATRRRAH